jgi:hypothetical protein
VGGVTVDLSDLAIATLVAAAVIAGLREGFAPLRAARWVWVLAGALLCLILVGMVWARAADASYSVTGNLISALKFVEYALLAPAVPLLLRRRADRRLLYWAVACWALVLTLIGALQFLGDLEQTYGRLPNRREPSYLDEHDFAAFSGAALTFGCAAILLRRGGWLGLVGGVAGAVGLALAAALDGIGAMWVAAAAMTLVVRRRGQLLLGRVLALLLLCAVVTVVAVTLRSSSIAAFLRFLGLEAETTQTTSNVQSFAHRTLLGYIGLEIWVHHPLLGVGWQESKRPHAFEPYLASARRLFGKSDPAQAFPSPQHMWGIQNGVIQTLAELGLVGFALLAALLLAVARLAVRVAVRGPPSLVYEVLIVGGWLIVGFAVFSGTSLSPGVTVDAQLWLGIGLVAALVHSLRISVPEESGAA